MPLPEHGDFKIYPWILPVPLRVPGDLRWFVFFSTLLDSESRSNLLLTLPHSTGSSAGLIDWSNFTSKHTSHFPCTDRTHRPNEDVEHDLGTKDYRRHNLNRRISSSTAHAPRAVWLLAGGLWRHHAGESRTWSSHRTVRWENADDTKHLSNSEHFTHL